MVTLPHEMKQARCAPTSHLILVSPLCCFSSPLTKESFVLHVAPESYDQTAASFLSL